MKTPTTFARVSATLVISLFSSIAFAQVTQVTSRAGLNSTDYIDWQSKATWADGANPAVQYTWVANGFIATSFDGMSVSVAQEEVTHSLINQEPSGFFRNPTNFAADDYLLNTYLESQVWSSAQPEFENKLTFTFSDVSGPEICGFGTQISPIETGAFVAKIQANYADGSTAILVDGITGDGSGNQEATFIGVNSTDPLESVDVSITSAGDGAGSFTGWYAINHVDFSECVPAPPPPPEVPMLSCIGFAAPMANHPVKAKKNRVLPLRMELFDELGFEQTNLELISQPVVTVLFTSSTEGSEAIDVSEDALPAGHGSDGNQFSFSDDGLWQYNLSPRNFSASAEGTYLVSVDSGDESAYGIDEACVTSFTIK